MRLFIDGEWNSYKGGLISMALVAEDGQEFYEVIGCEKPDPWVAEHVMPNLNKMPIGKVYFTRKLHDFLTGFDSIHIVADWPEDIEHFCRELIVGPGQRIGPARWTMEVVRLPDGAAPSKIPHNALEDARAMRDYLMSIEP